MFLIKENSLRSKKRAARCYSVLFRMVMAHAALAYIPKSLLISQLLDILFVMSASQKYHHSCYPPRIHLVALGPIASDNRKNGCAV